MNRWQPLAEALAASYAVCDRYVNLGLTVNSRAEKSLSLALFGILCVQCGKSRVDVPERNDGFALRTSSGVFSSVVLADAALISAIDIIRLPCFLFGGRT